MKSLYLTRIYPSHKIFTQAALVALMTFSMSDNIDNIIDNIESPPAGSYARLYMVGVEERGLAQWERLVREEARVREFVRFIDYC